MQPQAVDEDDRGAGSAHVGACLRGDPRGIREGATYPSMLVLRLRSRFSQATAGRTGRRSAGTRRRPPAREHRPPGRGAVPWRPRCRAGARRRPVVRPSAPAAAPPSVSQGPVRLSRRPSVPGVPWATSPNTSKKSRTNGSSSGLVSCSQSPSMTSRGRPAPAAIPVIDAALVGLDRRHDGREQAFVRPEVVQQHPVTRPGPGGDLAQAPAGDAVRGRERQHP